MKMLPRIFPAAALAALLALSFASPSRAEFAYGVTFLGNELVSVDTTTGAGTLVGPLGATNPFGLASAGDKLYTFDSAADVIRQIDPTTGAAQASFGIGLGVGSVLGQGGLAFQSGAVGFLTSALDPTTLAPVNNLYRFDISTGTSMVVANTPVALEALAFGPGGALFGLGKLDGNLYRIDTTTFATTVVGSTGISVGSPTGALTFGPDGMLYATLDDKLFTLDPMTGAATPVGPSDPSMDTGFSSISGLAFVRAVPEPSSVVLMGLGGAVLFAVARHRRRTSSDSI